VACAKEWISQDIYIYIIVFITPCANYCIVPRRAVSTRSSTSIGVRAPQPLLARIDALVRTGLYRSRAEVILDALRRSIDTLEREAGIQRPSAGARP